MAAYITSNKLRKTSKLRMLAHPIVVLWFITLFLLEYLFEWWDSLFLLLALMIVPIAALGIWLAGVPLWLLGVALGKLCRKQWDEAAHYLLVLPIGVMVAFVGLKCGDLVAIMTYGPLLEREVDAVKSGAPAKASNGMFSSPTMAFKLTGGFLDISVGIAYDSSGRIGKMLPLPPSKRPEDWQKNAVDVLSCQGSARHLFGDFYRVVVSSYSC